MPDQQDPSYPADPVAQSPEDRPAEGDWTLAPVRHTDDQRWQAAWERFGAASDGGEQQPAGPPAEQAYWAAPPQQFNGQPPYVARHSDSGRGREAPAPPAGAGPPYAMVPPPPSAPPKPASAADLTSATLLRPRDEVPNSGWRRLVHKASGGAINPGLSAAEQERVQLVRRIVTPVRGCHRIAVVSLKGGIGKTTTTASLGLTLAHHRGDRVVAVDANPDAGTLAERLTGQVNVTVRDLLAGIDHIRSFTDISAYTSQADRLQVLASEQDPEMSHAFDEEQYRAVAEVLARYFNIILTDSGTGLLHSAMAGTLALADSLVVVGAPSVDGASRAAKTLDWLIAHGYGELVYRSVAVISSVRPAAGDVDMSVLREHFARRCRAVVEIPYDAHLVTGGAISVAGLGRPTASAFLALAAAVADGFILGG